MKSKKGNFGALQALGIGIAGLIILFAVLFLVAASVKSQIVSTQSINESDASTFTTAYNSTNTLINAGATVPAWVPIIIVVAIGSWILLLVKKGF